jgi:hypothetical protein
VARIAQEHATTGHDVSFGASQTMAVMLAANSLNSTGPAAPTISQLSDTEVDAPAFPSFRIIDFWAADNSPLRIDSVSRTNQRLSVHPSHQYQQTHL